MVSELSWALNPAEPLKPFYNNKYIGSRAHVTFYVDFVVVWNSVFSSGLNLYLYP